MKKIYLCLLLVCTTSLVCAQVRVVDNKGTIKNISVSGIQNWVLTDAYVLDQLVINNDKIYQANDVIPASTPFLEGTTGATWTEISASTIVPLWVNDTNGGVYAINDIINYNGKLYKNLTGTNTDVTPDTDTTNWVTLGGSSEFPEEETVLTSSFTYTNVGGSGNISTATSAGASFDPMLVNERGLELSPDGTKMWVGVASGDIYQYSIPATGGIGGATLDGQWDAVGGIDINPYGISVSPDGLKMYVLHFGGNIYEFDLASPNDITGTAPTYTGNILTTAQGAGSEVGVSISPNGTSMLYLSNSSDTVYEYTLPTPFSLAGAVYSGRSISVSAQDSSPYEVKWSDDGSKFFVVGFTNDNIYEYSVTTNNTLTGAAYTGFSYSTNPPHTTMLGLAIRGDRALMMDSVGVTYPLNVSVNSTNTITDNNTNGQLGTLFGVGDVLTVSGTASNDGTVTVSSIVDADNILVANTLTNETVNSTLTLKLLKNGDIMVYVNGSWVPLPVGTDGQVLTVDSSSPTGLRWQ